MMTYVAIHRHPLAMMTILSAYNMHSALKYRIKREQTKNLNLEELLGNSYSWNLHITLQKLSNFIKKHCKITKLMDFEKIKFYKKGEVFFHI